MVVIFKPKTESLEPKIIYLSGGQKEVKIGEEILYSDGKEVFAPSSSIAISQPISSKFPEPTPQPTPQNQTPLQPTPQKPLDKALDSEPNNQPAQSSSQLILPTTPAKEIENMDNEPEKPQPSSTPISEKESDKKNSDLYYLFILAIPAAVLSAITTISILNSRRNQIENHSIQEATLTGEIVLSAPPTLTPISEVLRLSSQERGQSMEFEV